METEQLQALPPPPGVVGSLKAGFDAIASNISAILLPLALDLLLWFGPHLRVDHLFQPVFDEFSKTFTQADLPATTLSAFQETYQLMLTQFQHFNLLSLLRTFPIGIFSLMNGTMPISTPLGNPTVIEVNSAFTLIGLVGLLVFVGWIFGGLYFQLTSNVVVSSPESKLSRISWSILQTILLSVLWMMLAIFLGLPALIVLGMIAQISPFLGQAVLLILAVLSMWLIVPFFFMPHGIFVRRQNAFASIYTSLRMARFTLPTSSLFVLSILLIGFGLNFLWSVPPAASWMLLVGIAGHAFITTSLLAASFVYYRDMNVWLQTVFEKLKSSTPTRQA